ncbi:unnamed protein product [Scytosiphon promiscuus]
MADIKTLAEYDAAVGSSPKACVFFWAAWHEPSKPGGQMDEVFSQLADLHQGAVTCMKVEAEAVPEVSAKLDIATVPTFVLLKAGVPCGKIEGADPPVLAKRVQELASEPTASGSKEEGADRVLQPELHAKLKKLISASPVMLFMKGNSEGPKCKFSRKMVEILRGAGVDYGSFDILSDEDVRAGLKVYSNWPTFPQLYVKGVLVGGVDDVCALAEEGNLKAQLAVAGGVGVSAGVRANVGENTTAAGDAGGKSVQDRCKELVKSAETMVFMKGTPDAPRCGFSRTLVGLLREENIGFESFDILQDDGVRQGLKKLSNWPTYPQLYVQGELVGGLDIVKEMKHEGALAPQLGVTPKESLDSRLTGLISSSPVVLFMKGTPDSPQCGFSRTAVGLLREEGVEFSTFDILEDNEVRQGLKKFSEWPTYPQLYCGGELLGGLDIMKEMAQAGELKAALRPQP